MTKASIQFFVLLVTLAIAVTVSAQNFVPVKRVVDGDTLQLESGERVRLIGATALPSVPDRRFSIKTDLAGWSVKLGKIAAVCGPM